MIAGGRADGSDCALAREPNGRISGVCSFGINLVASADDPAAIDAFADLAKRMRVPRAIVGPRTIVEPLWGRLHPRFPAPFAVRTSQPVYALEPSSLPKVGSVEVGRATPAELDEIARHSATMTAGEVGRAPSPENSDFRGRIRGLIGAGKWWRYRVDGRLAFTCSVGAESPHSAQVQGVWTPPEMRGHGHATRGFAAICERLLAEHPTLCLYVNAFNRPAIALYERLGFTRVGEFQSIFL